MNTKTRQILLIIATTCVLPLISWVDHLTGPHYNFIIFYLAAILGFTWYGGKPVGYSVIAVGTLLVIHVNLNEVSPGFEQLQSAWNSFEELAILFLGVYFIFRLKKSLEIEKHLSRTDQLTGLVNRRAFEERVINAIEWCKRHEKPATLVYVDIDDFKKVNDSKGHDEGDRLLKKVANIMQEKLRKTDVVARMGGDEFALFFPETDENKSNNVLIRLQEQLHNLAFEERWPISVSIGFITDYMMAETFGEMLQRADKLMYDVKNSGKASIKYKIIK